jgi:hypothetical protein
VKPEALRRAWASVIQPGIDYMRRKTEEIEARRYHGDPAHDAHTGTTPSTTVRRRRAQRHAKLSEIADAPSGHRKSDTCVASL